MTAVKGLFEACVLLVIAAALAALSALVWVAIGGGSFLSRWGICLIVVGALFSVGGDMTVSRMGASDAFAWLGKGPERAGADDGGGRVLTGIGMFMFVALPLIILGGALTI